MFPGVAIVLFFFFNCSLRNIYFHIIAKTIYDTYGSFLGYVKMHSLFPEENILFRVL